MRTLFILFALFLGAILNARAFSKVENQGISGQGQESKKIQEPSRRIVREPHHRLQSGLHQGGQIGFGTHQRRIVREPHQGLRQGGQFSVNTQKGSQRRIIRDQTKQQSGFVSKQFATGSSGIEGAKNIEPRVTREEQEKAVKKGARISSRDTQGRIIQGGKISKKITKREIGQIVQTVPVDEKQRWTRCQGANQSIYDFTVDSLDGQPISLDKFKGKILLIVNVATFCAYTDQYLDFGPLLDKFPDLRILAFPSNQFGLQEPGENNEIINGIRYVRPGNNFQLPQNVQMFSKIDVNGAKQNPLYEHLKDACPPTVLDIGQSDQLFWNPIKVSDITWNFEKLLIDKEGVPRFRFHPTAWEKGQLMEEFIKEIEGGEEVQLEGSHIFEGGQMGKVGGGQEVGQ